MDNQNKGQSKSNEELNKKQLEFAQSLYAINNLRFAKMQRVQLLDANSNNMATNSYKKYTREQILSYLKDPQKNSTQLIEASNYLYTSSTIYNRVVRYLANMLTFDYVLSPYKMKEYDTTPANVEKYNKAYFKSLSELDIINIKHTFTEIMQVVVREGSFFGIEVSNKDSYMIQQMPYNKCKVTSWEDGCPIFSLDMSYFDKNQLLLESIGGELQSAYNTYLKDKKQKWAEIDGKSSICILFDETLNYIIPPLTGAFTDIYLIEDYKDLMKSKEIINLYKLINLKYPIDKDTGALLMDEEVARTYYTQMVNQLDDTIAVALNPFEMNEVSFSGNHADSDGTLKAQRDMFANIGVSNLVFSNEKASSMALVQSLVNDLSYILPCLRSFERWLNKKLKLASGTIKFQAMFPDISVYNRDSMIKNYREASSLGLPTKSLYAASLGLTPSQTINMTFMENSVLGLHDIFIPLQTSYTQSGDGGRPTNESNGDTLGEAGEQTLENNSNSNRA